MILLPPADMSTPFFHSQTKLSVHEYHFEKGTHTEPVDPQVVPMVLPLNLNLARSFAERKAVQEQNKLDAYGSAKSEGQTSWGMNEGEAWRTPCCGDLNERSKVQGVRFVVTLPSNHAAHGLYEYNDVDGAHAVSGFRRD